MESRSRPYILAQIKVTPAEASVAVRQAVNLTVTVSDVDIPAFVSEGKLYIQAPFGYVFKAVTKAISESLGYLEIRVSTDEGRTSFSLDRVGYPIHQ